MFGWITPSKEFIKVQAYCHLEEIGKNEKLSVYVPKLDDYRQRVQDACDSCQASVDAGEHGEWHHYEITQDTMSGRVVCDLYKAGCVRVGLPYQSSALHFEGTPEGINNLMQFCKDFAENHGYACKFEPQKIR